MRRAFAPVLIAIVVAVIAGAAVGASTKPSAAVVNGEKISEASVQADLQTLSTNPGYLCYLNASTLIRTGGQSGLGPVAGAGEGTLSTGFSSQWLDQLITNTLVMQRVAELGVGEPTSTELAAARQDLIGSINSTLAQVSGGQYACATTGAALLASLPASYADAQVKAQAASEALLSSLGGLKLDTASLESYFTAHSSDFDTICVSGILLADKATATSVRADLAAGADFATTAQAKSIDSASKASGGALGCFSPNSAQYQSVQKDVGSLTVGGLSQPLPSSNGAYVILTVTQRTPTSFSSIESIVRRSVLAADATRASGAASHLVRTAHVWVNPRYGSWSSGAAASGVVAPQSPPVSWIPNAAANVPSSSTTPSVGAG